MTDNLLFLVYKIDKKEWRSKTLLASGATRVGSPVMYLRPAQHFQHDEYRYA